MGKLEETKEIRVVTHKIDWDVSFSNCVNRYLNEGYELKEVKSENNYLYALLVR